MRFITAIGRNRIERQQFCIDTWHKFASEIVAYNTAQDIEFLKPHFKNVKFIECPSYLTGEKLYNKPDRVSIYGLAQCGPGLLINSDIKIDKIDKKSFLSTWSSVKQKLKVGIRMDFEGPNKPKKLNKYGIDAFLLTEEIIDKIPNLGFIIGTSIWDYWLVWHFTARHSFHIETISGHLYHLLHQSSWDKRDTEIGEGIMREHYGIHSTKLSKVIQALTGRNNG